MNLLCLKLKHSGLLIFFLLTATYVILVYPQDSLFSPVVVASAVLCAITGNQDTLINVSEEHPKLQFIKSNVSDFDRVHFNCTPVGKRSTAFGLSCAKLS